MLVKAISSKGQGATGSAGGRVGAHEVEFAVNPSRKSIAIAWQRARALPALSQACDATHKPEA
jgi:hypothetical protein